MREKQDNLPIGMSKKDAAKAVERLIYSGFQRQIDELREQLDFHPRAAKLMAKHKPFLVIANDEPYYLLVYGLIRRHEQENQRWSDEDEKAYLDAINTGTHEQLSYYWGKP